jgi:hypothetical protein
MNRLDDPRELNRDQLLDTIYRIQTDLKILVEQLAGNRQMDLTDQTLMELSWFQCNLQKLTPSLRRH